MQPPRPSGDPIHGEVGEPATPAGAVDAGFLPPSPPRANIESVVVRCIATAGIVGIGTALGAICISLNAAGWITGLVVSLVSVVLAALLWRSRRL
jgi:protein-S-isoprenylcysteine O-methyltransferase Ste14